MAGKRKSSRMPSENLRAETAWPERAGGLPAAKYFAINAFVIFHLLAILCWALPINTPVTLKFRNFVRPYFIWSGLFQTWDMFAPNPKATNGYVEAIIIYKDGTTDLWTFPRMELLSYRDRYFEERYRKYEENLSSDFYPALWPDAARHVARMYRTHASPPRKIMLVARWSEINPPTARGNERGPWEAHVFYSYDVQPEDLQ
jgi:hypothetical protein